MIRKVFLVLILFILPVVVVAGGCRRQEQVRLKVLTSNTLLGAVVQEVGGDRVAVTAVVPAGFCPGHFDISPAVLVAGEEARLMLSHGWETWLERLRSALKNPRLKEITVTTKGNWMVPPVHLQAIDEVAAILIRVDPAGSRFYEQNRQRYRRQVDSVTKVVQGMFANRSLPRVIVADRQADFLRFLGFPVVATYGRAEDWSAQEMFRLARVIVDSGVGLVVDNLQSGPETGKPLADAAKVKHVTLSNFPLTGDYIRTLVDNAEKLVQAIP